ERARSADRTQEGSDSRVCPAKLEDLFDDGAVLALKDAHALVVRLVVLVWRDLDAQVAGAVGLRGAGDASVQSLDHHRVAAARNAHLLADLGHGPDSGEFVVSARHEQDAP